MMQALEEKLRSLRRRVRHWLESVREPPADSDSTANPCTANRSSVSDSGTSARLAHDLGLPHEEVSRILDRTAADLRQLSESDSDDVDARPIIDRAVSELAKLGFESRPFEEAAMEQFLRELPERDYQILRLFKLGEKHSEIAAQLDTTVEEVRSSLVKTYAELRMRMIGSTDDGGGGEPCEVPPSMTYTKPPKQTSLYHS
ncbi:sigma-70 RNA polymerase sigma factor region 4 domain-containing protein [Peristeroidobacter agariperforans]|uniref:sigma-70 family RNA polymerase sigma factor n=1 Tax=Peristeroidobacter agariperforans TaxID=268404 RepID=UPI00101C687B|nr:sigma-70 family RNA polymerase sigma factor [Peristeroidobacter agariperforans]